VVRSLWKDSLCYRNSVACPDATCRRSPSQDVSVHFQRPCLPRGQNCRSLNDRGLRPAEELFRATCSDEAGSRPLLLGNNGPFVQARSAGNGCGSGVSPVLQTDISVVGFTSPVTAACCAAAPPRQRLFGPDGSLGVMASRSREGPSLHLRMLDRAPTTLDPASPRCALGASVSGRGRGASQARAFQDKLRAGSGLLTPGLACRVPKVRHLS
jgi:hypothetical protein